MNTQNAFLAWVRHKKQVFDILQNCKYNVSVGQEYMLRRLHSHFYFLKGNVLMRMDTYSLARAGLSEDEILAIANNKDEKEQMRMLRKYRFRLLDDIHSKQQSLDTIDHIISRMKKHA